MFMYFELFNPNFATSNVRYGTIKTKSLSYQLESLTIELSHIEYVAIEPNDLIRLTDEMDVKSWWCVGKIHENIVKKTTPQLYDYTIDLVEPTKLLQDIELPNMTITNIGQNRSIYFYIDKVLKRYFSNEKTNTINYDASLYTLLNNKTSPENGDTKLSTLREYIDFLFSVVGYRSKLIYNGTYFVLSYLDLNTKNGIFPVQYVSKIEGSQTSEDYVSELSSDLQNVVSPDVVVEYHKLKTTDLILTTNTANLILDNKPYDLKSIKVLTLGLDTPIQIGNGSSSITTYDQNGVSYYTYSNGKYTKVGDCVIATDPTKRAFDSRAKKYYISPIVDITQNVITSKVYDARELLDAVSYTTAKMFTNEIYKNNTIIWNRNDNEITGINLYQTMKDVITTYQSETALELAYKNCLCKSLIKNAIDVSGTTYITTQGNTATFPIGTYRVYTSGNYYIMLNIQYASVSGSAYSPFNAKFRCVYRPFLNTNLRQRKDNYKHLVTMANNSTNATTDLLTFYDQTKNKNNQLGNKALSFFGMSGTTSEVFELGQKYTITGDGDYYVNMIEITHKLNCIMYKGTMTKNYANLNIYTSLNREKRYYALADDNAMVDRKETFFANASSVNEAFTSDLWGAYRFGVSIYDADNYFLGSTNVKQIMMNDGTMIYTFEMLNNIAIAFRTSDDYVEGDDQVYKSEYVPYTDDNGECGMLKFKIYAIDFDNTYYSDEFKYYHNANDYNDATLSFTMGNNFLKDNRERLVITLNVK